MIPNERIQISPYCSQLRSKKMVFQTHPPQTHEDILDGSGHTWCELSQETVALDGEVCCPEDCQSGRACFQPYGGPEA
jgi:hypothetical protein